MGTVYVSHASDIDVRLLDSFASSLRAEGHFVATCRDFPSGGDELINEVARKIIVAADLVVVFWTPRSANTLQTLNQARLAADLKKLVQVLCGVDTAPEQFRSNSFYDVSRWNGEQSDPDFRGLMSDMIKTLAPDDHLTMGAESDTSHSSRDEPVDDYQTMRETLINRLQEAEERVKAATDQAYKAERRAAQAEAYASKLVQEAQDTRDLLRSNSAYSLSTEESPAGNSEEPRFSRLLEARLQMFEPSPSRADASAFAPRTMQRGSSELVRVVVHPPEQRKAVEKSAKALDAKAAAAGPASPIGYVLAGAMVGVLLDVKGGKVTALSTDKPWTGDAIEFVFSVEASESQKVTQAVITARIMVDGAQVGLIAFVRPLSKPKTNSSPQRAFPVREKFRRAKRVFLSYSSQDRETVSVVAGAYQRAGIPCFFDRTSLEGGEEWSPRLLKEIRRSDLFHLFWSKNASNSEWVVKETEHALQKRRASWTKRPNITVQMLDGPPWAPHPPHLNAINFDDFVRAAVVGYARGEG